MFWKSTLLYTASLLILSGCVGTNPTPKKETLIDSTLPVVELTQDGVYVDMEAIAFEWKSIKDPRVQGVYIYKATPNKENVENELKYFKTINNRFSTHYTDVEVAPNTKYIYAFKTFSNDAEGQQSRVVEANSLSVLESVSWLYSETGMPRTAKIIWRPHQNQSVKSYILERKTLEEEKWKTLTTINGRLNAEYIDENLKDSYVYEYRIKVKTYDGLVSLPSEIVKVVTKALPVGVTNIKTTLDMPKKIKITWEPTLVKDFQFYYLYRADGVDGNYKLIATLYNPVFTDNLEEDGKSYFYRVSVVDKDGLESEHEKVSIQGMSIPRPAAPSVITANIVDNKAEIEWSKVDPRTTSYIVVKKIKQGWFDESVEEFANIKNKRFLDSHIEDGASYAYIVYAVDANGIKSNPSIEIKFKTKESKEPMKAIKSEPKKEVYVSKPVDASDTTQIIAPSSDLDVSGL